jgi:hypothetical protein
MSDTQIRLRSGKLFDLAAPLPSDVVIHDIAFSLAMQPRFVGHTRFHYSVAQHSTRVAKLCPASCALEGLLHDAAEAYIGDITRPLKILLGERLKEIETNIERAIALRYGLMYPWPAAVKEADNAMLRIEQYTFWPGTTDSQTGEVRTPEAIAGEDRISRIVPEEASEIFLGRFRSLCGQRGIEGYC